MQQDRMLTYKPKIQITITHLHIHLKGQFSVARSPSSALLIELLVSEGAVNEKV